MAKSSNSKLHSFLKSKYAIPTGIGVILVLWGLTFLLFLIEDENRGAFGDMFGAINALFSGLALGGIVYSIILQQNELSLQRKELSDTREEFKDQNFQTTFFNLLRTHRQIVDEININVKNLNSKGDEYSKNVVGRDYFLKTKSELKRIFDALNTETYQVYSNLEIEDAHTHFYTQYGMSPEADEAFSQCLEKVKHKYSYQFYDISEIEFTNYSNLNPTDKLKFVYTKYFGKFGYAVGHYFRNLYHILLFLEKSHLERLRLNTIPEKVKEINSEFHNYAKFIQAQLNTPELFVLFYNAFNYPKAKKLLIDYQLLDVLPKSQLLLEEHKELVPEFNLHDS